MLQGDGTYATTLLVWALDTIGPELLTWHPLTIKQEVEAKGGCTITKANLDKLLAAVVVVTTDVFYKDVARFIQLANVLSGDDFQPDEFDPADTVECAWAITEALLLSPPEDSEQEPFSEDIRHYVTFILREEGYLSAPDVLKIAIDHDIRSAVNADFADDPSMFKALYENQAGKTQEVEDLLKLALEELLQQLQALPLRQGSTAQLQKKLSTLSRKE